MLRGKDGICGHLHELEPEMIAAPYVKRAYVKAWEKGNQEGWGAEISGNYRTGYIEFAYTLGDDEMKKTATEWVDAVLKRQRPDGYTASYVMLLVHFGILVSTVLAMIRIDGILKFIKKNG